MLNGQIVHSVGPRVMNRALATILLVVTCVSLVVAPATSLAASTTPFPFADNNNNGVYDPGIDTDITEELKNGFYSTSQSIVLPAKMKAVKTTTPYGVSLSAGKNITIAGDVNAGAYASGLTAMADGDLTVGPGAKVTGRTYLHLVAGGDLVIGAKASIIATHAKEGMLWLGAEGDVTIGDHVKLRGHSRFNIASENGTVTVGQGIDFDAGPNDPYIWSHGQLVVVNDN